MERDRNVYKNGCIRLQNVLNLLLGNSHVVRVKL